jgi:hypothetical protein
VNATVTFFAGDERLSGAKVTVDGQTHVLDDDGSVVLRVAPGLVACEVEVGGELRRREFHKHGSAARFIVDVDAADVGDGVDGEHPFPRLVGLVGDRFRIDEVVARAATGTVVRAYDRIHGRTVALRAPSDELATIEEAHQVFVVEARNLLELEHPNLLKIFDVLAFKGRAVLVTEWVEGETLDRMMREGRVGPSQAWDWVLPIASGVAQLHREDIVHRDLHGANIIVRPDGGVKLIDLGLARSLADVYLGAARVHDSREHWAPEQFQGLHVTPATDVYQLTLLFYRCWARGWPFEDGDLERAHLEAEPAPLGAPDLLEQLVTRGLDKNPRHRFPNAEYWFREFSGAREVLASAVPAEPVADTAGFPMRPVVAGVVSLVGMGLAVVVGLLVSGVFDAQREPVQLGDADAGLVIPEQVVPGQVVPGARASEERGVKEATATGSSDPAEPPEAKAVDAGGDVVDAAQFDPGYDTEAPENDGAGAETSVSRAGEDSAAGPRRHRESKGGLAKSVKPEQRDETEVREQLKASEKRADAKSGDDTAEVLQPSLLLDVDDGSSDSVLLPVDE